MKDISYDDILETVGGAGRWQFCLFGLCSLCAFIPAFHMLGAVFLAYEPNHWCQIPGWQPGSNASDELKAMSIPRDNKIIGGFSRCKIYNLNYSTDLTVIEGHDFVSNESLEQVSCYQWTYDQSDMDSSAVTRWNLVCERKALGSTVQATFMAGFLIGCSLHGFLADRFGRRISILTAVLELSLSSLLAAASPYYELFIFLRFLSAIGAAGVYTVSFIQVTENCSGKVRDLFGIEFEFPFALGYMVLPGIAYILRDFTYIQLAIGAPSLILISYFWVLPESPRWLIARGRCQHAVKVLRSVANTNRRQVSDEHLRHMVDRCYQQGLKFNSDGSESTRSNVDILVDLFRTPQMRKQTLVSYFMYFSVSASYYGLAFSLPALGDNVFFVSFLAAVVELPAYIAAYLLVKYTGRKWSSCGTFAGGGAACIVIAFVPRALPGLLIGIALAGKFCIAIVFAILYLYTAEIFPTQVRSFAVGTSSMCARIGSILSPYIVDLLGRHNPIMPTIIIGVLCLLSGILCVFLPETRGVQLPETVFDVEKRASKSSKKLYELTPISELK